jgi:hypothetical protein
MLSPQGLKPDRVPSFTARLKSCPDTKPQGLKPVESWGLTARLKPCPFKARPDTS